MHLAAWATRDRASPDDTASVARAKLTGIYRTSACYRLFIRCFDTVSGRPVYCSCCVAYICDKPQSIGVTGTRRRFGDRCRHCISLVFSLLFTMGDLILLLRSITAPSPTAPPVGICPDWPSPGYFSPSTRLSIPSHNFHCEENSVAVECRMREFARVWSRPPKHHAPARAEFHKRCMLDGAAPENQSPDRARVQALLLARPR